MAVELSSDTQPETLDLVIVEERASEAGDLLDRCAALASTNVQAVVRSVDQLNDVLERHLPEVVLLSTTLAQPVLSTLDALEEPPLVILVGTYGSYAMHALSHRSIDCLAEPFTDERLQISLDRAADLIAAREARACLGRLERNLARSQNAIEELSRQAYPERLALRVGSSIAFVDTADISHIASEGVYSRVQTVSGGAHVVREALSTFEKRLDPRWFVRIHRSCVVNLRFVALVEPHPNGGGRVTMTDGLELRASRSYRDRIAPVFG